MCARTRQGQENLRELVQEWLKVIDLMGLASLIVIWPGDRQGYVELCQR